MATAVRTRALLEVQQKQLEAALQRHEQLKTSEQQEEQPQNASQKFHWMVSHEQPVQQQQLRGNTKGAAALRFPSATDLAKSRAEAAARDAAFLSEENWLWEEEVAAGTASVQSTASEGSCLVLDPVWENDIWWGEGEQQEAELAPSRPLRSLVAKEVACITGKAGWLLYA